MSTTANKNVWINFVSGKVIHDAQATAEDGTVKAFKNLSFQMADGQWASVSLRSGQVKPATKKDGSEIENTYNILLGKPGTERQVSYKKSAKSKKYTTATMTVDEIAELIKANQAAYRASQKAEAPADAE